MTYQQLHADPRPWRGAANCQPSPESSVLIPTSSSFSWINYFLKWLYNMKIDWQNFTFILYMSVFRCFILKQFHACPELEEMHPCKNKWGLWKPFAPTFQLVQLTNHGNVGFESPIDSATSLAVKLSACA